jgi:2-oxoglutarate ferredoxin oxidoreductase subunit alpha
MNYCRVKAFPFGDEVRDFLDKHERVYVVEQNRDAQLRSLLILDLEINPARLVPVLHYNGMPITARFVTERVMEELAKGRAA